MHWERSWLLFSVAQCSWGLGLDFCLPAEQILLEGLAEGRAGGPVDLGGYLVLLRKAVVQWLLQADRLQTSSGSPPSMPAANPVASSIKGMPFPLSGGSSLWAEIPSFFLNKTQPSKQEFYPSTWRYICFLTSLHQAPASCDGPRWFIMAPTCRQHPGSLWWAL